MPTGLVYHPIFLEHDTGRMHPECPERLRAILKRLDADGLRQELAAIPPREAERVWLERVHTPRHLRDLRDGVAMAGERLCYLDHETPVSSASESAALSAAGGALAAVDAVLDGSVDNAFCLVRPPGHHAEPDRIMGFCLLNSVAIAARYLQHRHGIRRVLIVDWDVHHGNESSTFSNKIPGSSTSPPINTRFTRVPGIILRQAAAKARVSPSTCLWAAAGAMRI